MASVAPAAKKQKRECHFDNKWIKEFKGIGKGLQGKNITYNETFFYKVNISMEYRNKVKKIYTNFPLRYNVFV